MNNRLNREETIFHEALRLAPDKRAAYLALACAEDQSLRNRIERLLEAQVEADPFFGKEPLRVALGNNLTDRATVLAVTEQPGDRIGRYKLLQQIGEGGCGVVYVAEQEEPVRRRVALKVIKLGMDTKSVIARFEAERQALALMDHPNIAKVLDAGATATGRPFFVMELVRGIKITDYCDQNNLATCDRLGLFIQVCHAIQHAHQKGIIHRDIKPSNILVTLHDGVPVPKVIDFGIAKATSQQRLTDKTVYTAFEQFIGTPAYMSPEQAEMSGLDIDTRSDVYALGVLLYELLTGKTPFDPSTLMAAGLDEMRRIIREQEPVRPSTRLGTMLAGELTTTAGHRRAEPPKLIHLLQRDLDWIVMKALEKDRTRRYETANSLALDIECHLKHEPVTARPPSTAYRVQKFVRRNKLMVTAGAAVAAALMLGMVVSTWQAVRASRLRAEAEANERKAVEAQAKETAQRQIAEEKTEENRQRLVQINVGNGSRLVGEDQTFAALPWFIEALRLEQGTGGGEDLQRRRLGLLLQQSPKLAQVWFHEQPVNCAAFSPDGRRVATGTGRTVLFSADKGTPGQVQVWDAETGQPIGRPLVHGGSIRQLQFSPDGRRVATASADGTARLMDSVSGDPIFQEPFSHSNSVIELAFNRDGTLLATGSPDNTARVWDTQNGRCLAVLQHGFQVNGLDFNPDGSQLLTTAAYLDGLVCVWDARTGSNLVTNRGGHTAHIMSVRWSPDGSKWATASADGTAKIWDANHAKELVVLRPYSAVISVEFSRDGRRLLMFSEDSTARIWDTQTGALLAPPIRHDGMSRAEFSPDGLGVVTASRDHTARVWDARTSQPLTPSLTHQDEVLQASFSPDGHRLLTVSADHTVRLWELAVGEPTLELAQRLPVTRLALSPDQRRVLTVGRQGVAGIVQVWDVKTGERIGPVIQHLRAVSEAAFSPDGQHLLTASFDRTARVWRADTGDPVTPPLAHLDGVAHAAFSPDGHRVATGSLDKTAVVWDAVTGQPVTPPLTHDREVQWVAFSPDGQRLVTASRDRLARVWDARTGRELLRLKGHTDWVLEAVFSPNGRQILTASSDRTARLWEAATGASVPPLVHLDVVKTAAFSRDGKRVVTASYDRTARIWDAASGRAVTPPLTHVNGVEHAAFSGDGGWVVTASWDGTVRLWNATDGGPITPSIRLGSGVRHALLNTDGQVLVAASASAASVWHWAKEEQSLDDLDRMTRLLTGQGSDPQGRVVPLRREDIQQLWQTLRTKPAPAPEAVVQSWHRRALAQALEQRDASAVRFHVEHLLRHAPGEERLLELRAKLASNNGISADGAWTLTDLFAENRSHVPPRAAGTPDNLIDLSDFYDKPLTEAGHWDGPSELYNLSMLPRGVHTLAGMPFDLRGWVRLTGIPGAYAYAPERVSGISVGRRCRRLHFLHGTAYPKETGTQIANYVIHYADGQLRERPVLYGNDVQNFKWQSESELTEHPEAVRAWIGTNYLTAEMGYRYRLYKSVWENPRPDVTVATIDFRSRLVFSAPFLIAITAE